MSKSIFCKNTLSLPVTEEAGKLCTTPGVIAKYRLEMIEHIVNISLSEVADYSNKVALMFACAEGLSYCLLDADAHPDTKVTALLITNEGELGEVAGVMRIHPYQTTAGRLEAGYFFNACGNKKNLGNYQIVPIPFAAIKKQDKPSNRKVLAAA